MISSVINPQRACARVTVVSLSVCLSTSDFEDGGIFTFENGHQRELGDNLSPLNVAL